jgi:hypothetical protein
VAINFSNHSLGGGQYPLVFGAQEAARYAPLSEARYTPQLNADATRRDSN